MANDGTSKTVTDLIPASITADSIACSLLRSLFEAFASIVYIKIMFEEAICIFRLC